jgi:mono/diheme cytochrome c family protein
MKTDHHMDRATNSNRCTTQPGSCRGRIFKPYAFAMVLVLTLATAAQTAPKLSKHDNSVYAELAKAPRKAAARRNPLATDPDAVAAGGKLFAQHCAECHGDMAEGGKKGPQPARGRRATSHARNAVLVVDQWRRSPGHARVVQAPRTSALAVG